MNAVEKRFDTYCKRVIQNSQRNYINHETYIATHYTTIMAMDKIFATKRDMYFVHRLRVNNDVLDIGNENLYEALLLLPKESLKIIVLYYGGGISENKIAVEISMPKSTVHHKRKRALEMLRQRMVVQ